MISGKDTLTSANLVQRIKVVGEKECAAENTTHYSATYYCKYSTDENSLYPDVQVQRDYSAHKGRRHNAVNRLQASRITPPAVHNDRRSLL